MAKKQKNGNAPRTANKKSNAAIKSESPDTKSSFRASSDTARNDAGRPQAGKARAASESKPSSGNPLRTLVGKVGKLFSRRSASKDSNSQPDATRTASSATPATPVAARTAKRTTDVEMDALAQSYTPTYTASKAGFRSDGSDHQQDQELAIGVTDERWNDEDRFTNKSGDPRIGTRGRSYEPGETRRASASNRNEEDLRPKA
jgi:hypothetical protein